MATDYSALQTLNLGVSAYSNPPASPLSNGSYLAATLGGRAMPTGAGSGGSLTQSQNESRASNSPSLSPKSSAMHSSNDTLNSSASISSGVGSHNSSITQSPSPGSNASLADYLSQLIKDRKQLESFPHIFYHVERLLDEEINKVRVNLFQVNSVPKDPMVLPEVQGMAVTLTEKVYVPVDEYPDFNFVGRILGPRGLTAKQLEKDTQCKIMIRGKGSTRDKQKETQNKGKPNWEHLGDKLHVLITVEDTADRARIKLSRAVEEIKKLLVPMTEADDELKKRQLMELAIINGTYRDNGPKSNPSIATALPQYYGLHLAMARQQALGAPLMLPPRSVSAAGSSPYYHHTSSGSPSPLTFSFNDAASAAAAAGLFNPYDYAAYNPALAQSLLTGEYSLEQLGAVGGVVKQKRHLGAARDHPYSRALAAAMAQITGAVSAGSTTASSSTI